MSQNLIKPILSLCFALLIGIAVFLVLMRVDVYLRNQAIDACAINGTYEVIDGKTKAKISYPLPDVYQACLKLKNIK